MPYGHPARDFQPNRPHQVPATWGLCATCGKADPPGMFHPCLKHVCTECGAVGHTKNFCPELWGGAPRCIECGAVGHKKNFCPKRWGGRRLQPPRHQTRQGRGRRGGRGRGPGGFRPRRDRARAALATPAQPVNQVSMMAQRSTHHNQAMHAVHQQPAPRQAYGPKKKEWREIERAQSYAGNMPAVENGRERVYVNPQSHFVDPTVNHNHNKNLDMHVIEERERERWGGTHAPPSPPQVHDAPV